LIDEIPFWQWQGFAQTTVIRDAAELRVKAIALL